MKFGFSYIGLFISLISCSSVQDMEKKTESISGIYPKLAYYNNEGECGTGAVVPWANRLWVITYAPHSHKGSSDKLYEITSDYKQIVRKESIGGTPANRMIHKESNQLFIGPYVIDSLANVRVVSWKDMPGRLTGNARHLSDPSNKILYATMEEGFYSVDVHSLKVDTLYLDGNMTPKKKGVPFYVSELLPGAHGKGFYSGQGVAVFSNNGENSREARSKFDVESGVLAEWDGKNWTVVRRNQFTEVTGPGGIGGNGNPETDPIWATGWDYKSILLGVRDYQKGWKFYRLPKASHSYDGAHGWNTEWPRIRNVGEQGATDYLMTMHGMFWKFPGDFNVNNTRGIRPRSAYLKVIGDFTRWNGQLVFGCDDSAQKEFLNKRKAKGGIEGPGQSNSNLWFTSFSKPDELGPATADGAVWANETVKAGEYSEPFLFSGWSKRCAWVRNEGNTDASFIFEVDVNGTDKWEEIERLKVKAGESSYILFDKNEKAEWIRVKSETGANVTVSFNYTSNDDRGNTPSEIFKGLYKTAYNQYIGGLLYGLGNNRRALGVVAHELVDGKMIPSGYYEMGDELKLVKKDDTETADFILSKFAVPDSIVTIEDCSVLIVDDLGRRWRLPLGAEDYRMSTNNGLLRVCREVATERDLFSCMGTFYELPAENADGFAKIRPVSTHPYHINDYASYRGMLVMTGIDPDKAGENPHIVVSDDKKAAVWVGAIDDLWEMGKPVGRGGPWKDTRVKAGEISDPYLIGFYDKKYLTIKQDSDKKVEMRVEVDPTGNGDWMEYASYLLEPGVEKNITLDDSFQARWIRFSVNADTKATVWLEYK